VEGLEVIVGRALISTIFPGDEVERTGLNALFRINNIKDRRKIVEVSIREVTRRDRRSFCNTTI